MCIVLDWVYSGSYESQEKERDAEQGRGENQYRCANEQATAVGSGLSPVEDLSETLQNLSAVVPLECVICGLCPVTPTSGLPWLLD